MSPSVVSKFPLLFFIVISIWWGFYYQSNSSLNDFGQANFEFLYLLDAFIVLPIICFLAVKNKKEALLKAVALCCLAVWVGSYIIPESSKFIWPYLENGRYVVSALILLFEAAAIVTVILAIKTALYDDVDPDLAISQPIERFLGKSAVATILNFETRMWTFTLFAMRVKSENYQGSKHFTYHQKDGSQSNLLGFVFLIALEMPLMHLLLHFVWSPMAANVVTALSALSLVFFLAEYRAFAKRPISIDGHDLIIRYGLYQPFRVSLSNITSVNGNDTFVAREKNIKRYNYSGVPNVELVLAEPIGQIERIYLGVDNPQQFIASIKHEF
ncbi:hypothetical protein [Pseudoalteromonas luteoviolacea]|uniref:Uncharacterized protein n=1 Tax=Pseudoalteromonas luteoviolacea NCIMB 1942 TaxID=1365253 RepID=A0A167A962_9GAMM|nr:hypothetical protein [Pseudoalteromonas luteoviolacea]KZN45116.1 hypothetical protein N482_15165 [Pseudoalteromonas luteoviolacea NCIMB 1942]